MFYLVSSVYAMDHPQPFSFQSGLSLLETISLGQGILANYDVLQRVDVGQLPDASFTHLTRLLYEPSHLNYRANTPATLYQVSQHEREMLIHLVEQIGNKKEARPVRRLICHRSVKCTRCGGKLKSRAAPKAIWMQVPFSLSVLSRVLTYRMVCDGE